jgi:hypothetical protein
VKSQKVQLSKTKVMEMTALESVTEEKAMKEEKTGDKKELLDLDVHMFKET